MCRTVCWPGTVTFWILFNREAARQQEVTAPSLEIVYNPHNIFLYTMLQELNKHDILCWYCTNMREVSISSSNYNKKLYKRISQNVTLLL